MDPFGAELSPLRFFGENFVKQFVMADHEDQPVLFDGCLLLSDAHAMALTGRGTRTALLELKSRVFRCINDRMEVSDSLLSPQCLSAILALGAPINCVSGLPRSAKAYNYLGVHQRIHAGRWPMLSRIREYGRTRI